MATVEIHVYDLSNGLARVMSPAVVGKLVEIIPHTGVVVTWADKPAAPLEYFFGGGICVTPAGKSVPMPACERLTLGTTSKTEEELMAFLHTASPRFTAETYNLLSHNCNHFSNEVALFLTGQGVPDRIVNVARDALSEPQGQAIRNILEGMQANINQQNQANALNPFGAVPSAALSAPAAPAAAPAAPSSAAAQEETATALREVMTAGTEPARACLTTLRKVAQNLVEHPADDKYRRIKMSNGAFQKKVVDCVGGTEAMLCLGFCPEECDGVDYWVWGAADPDKGTVEHARTFEKQVAAQLATLPAPPAPPPAPAPAPAPAPSPFGAAGMGGMGGMGGMSGMGGGMGGMGGGMGGMPAGMNPAMMQQAQQMMQNNPAMMQQAQQMMQNPAMMAQAQQMMQDPQAMEQMMQMMNSMGGSGMGGMGGGGMGGMGGGGMGPY